MKITSTAFMLIMGITALAADNDKRPSWSQGLPEKNEAPEFNKPKMDIESIKIERPTFDHQLMKPEVQFMGSINQSDKQSKVAINDANSTVPESSSAKKPAASQQTQQLATQTPQQNKTAETAANNERSNLSLNDPASESFNTTTNDSPKQQNETYSWEIIRQFPVSVSQRVLASQSSILVKIFINANGEVIAIEPVLSNTSTALVNMAERSIKRWKFVSPQAQGFEQQVLSRVFKVMLTERS